MSQVDELVIKQAPPDDSQLFDVYNLVMKQITIATRESALALWQAISFETVDGSPSGIGR